MKMLIGLTGKTGSGKSLAAEIFRGLGAFVADCDKIAHSILTKDDVKNKIREVFSDKVFNFQGDIDRKKLGEIVFSDKEKLLSLNKIVHPIIIREALRQCAYSKKDICLIDGSELEASGVDEKCDLVVVITADKETRTKRIMKRDGIDYESAVSRINAQKDYSKEAIFIENNSDEASLKEKIKSLYNSFSGDLNE